MDWFDEKWAAAFFDGEGCIHIARNIRVVIGGCFRPGLLDAYAQRWGGRVTFYDARKPNQRPGVRWEITGRKAAAFLRDVLPYLYEKRDQAEVALEYQALKNGLNVRGGKGHTPENRLLFADYERRLRSMKKRPIRKCV